jgi:hypothetical protein
MAGKMIHSISAKGLAFKVVKTLPVTSRYNFDQIIICLLLQVRILAGVTSSSERTLFPFLLEGCVQLASADCPDRCCTD